MDRYEIEKQCRELEDAYAEALKSNAGVGALSEIWKRLQELHKALNAPSQEYMTAG